MKGSVSKRLVINLEKDLDLPQRHILASDDSDNDNPDEINAPLMSELNLVYLGQIYIGS